MTVLSNTKYKRISAAMLGVIVFACFSVVALPCSMPAVSDGQVPIEINGQDSPNRCPVAKRTQSVDYSECCCALTALVKADTLKLPYVAILIQSSAGLAFVDPLIKSVSQSDPGQLSSDESPPPIYLATRRLRI